MFTALPIESAAELVAASDALGGDQQDRLLDMFVIGGEGIVVPDPVDDVLGDMRVDRDVSNLLESCSEASMYSAPSAVELARLARYYNDHFVRAGYPYWNPEKIVDFHPDELLGLASGSHTGRGEHYRLVSGVATAGNAYSKVFIDTEAHLSRLEDSRSLLLMSVEGLDIQPAGVEHRYSLAIGFVGLTEVDKTKDKDGVHYVPTEDSHVIVAAATGDEEVAEAEWVRLGVSTHEVIGQFGGLPQKLIAKFGQAREHMNGRGDIGIAKIGKLEDFKDASESVFPVAEFGGLVVKSEFLG